MNRKNNAAINNTMNNNMKTSAANLGFTLIELLVVISTSSLLIGLLLPAVQR